MTISAYVASPLGFSEAGRCFYERQLLPLLRDIGFDILDPWMINETAANLLAEIKQMPVGTEQLNRWGFFNRIVGETNEMMIRQCDLLIGVLDGTDVDSGTASEIGAAAMLDKAIEGYRGDFRLRTYPQSLLSPQKAIFHKESPPSDSPILRYRVVLQEVFPCKISSFWV